MDQHGPYLLYTVLMLRRPSHSRRPLAAIPEESGFSVHDDDVEYVLDLGSGATESACPTPTPSHIKRPIASKTFRPSRSAASVQKEAERDCGICFERAVAPVRTPCCSHLFCAEHIAAWLDGPAADGLCPTCRAPCAGLLALGHAALIPLVPPPPPPSRSPSPAPEPYLPFASDCSSDDPSDAESGGSYASYPSTPASLSPAVSDASEEEDATDYSLPALVRARALQTRRHAPHPFTSVVGLRGALGSVARVAGWLLIVAVLAGRGRWAAE
ncbi:hypothetical protein DFH07DRAFT_1065671 [Mycena maculata]|uniref:RING-type domain-containing protein n=1 Tax=Mycena maculata TaxID=230809 RepID=A0AAD7I148_9AGAR|nr:hypothetical protein DFH07DRAFT_1065671 [Mycena maculata]